MKVLSVVGARPNFMKVAPIISAIRKHNELARQARGAGAVEHVLLHTGQHYDKNMSGIFFRDLELPAPDIFLGVGPGSHAAQTSEIMKRFEGVLLKEKPNLVIVVGDVNSTVACALVSSKIFYGPAASRPLIAHVEAGLRSFDRSMPEEINRILTDHVSDILFVTEQSGVKNLKAEGIPGDKIYFVGNTMIDTLLAFRNKAGKSKILQKLNLVSKNKANPYALLTLHRPSNVDNKGILLEIIQALEEFSGDLPIIFPAHPRTEDRIKTFDVRGYFNSPCSSGHGIKTKTGKINLIRPLGYLDFLCLMKNAKLVLTDSGGVQEETTCLGVPCVTIRENTERSVTVTEGTNIIAGVNKDGIIDAIRYQLGREVKKNVPKNCAKELGRKRSSKDS
jgi:UDP-N-acetylglucosamine 2-epimerase (non-hydrolysing)